MLIRLNANSGTPVYLQLEAALRRKINNGRWKPGKASPAERQLAKDLKISHITLRTALLACGTAQRRRGSNQSRRPSPRKLNPITRREMAAPGKMAAHGLSSI